MLVKCPECELQVSDKAITCPHCGYPMKQVNNFRKSNKNNKHRRLPNGFGQISEIKNRNLRNPFRAMVTVGKNSKGRPICKPLKPESYFPTYNDAYAALVEYNRNPYDLEDDITVKELYEKWTDEYFKSLNSTSSIRTITSAWAYCSSIYNMRAKDVRSRHIKGCIDNGVAIINGEKRMPTVNMKSRIKSLFNIMFDYAVEYEIIDKNYSRTFNLSGDIIKEMDNVKRGHIPFTDYEMNLLWENINNLNYVDIILIQCYSGWRPQELGLIELKNVNINDWTMMGGIKTKAGKDRIVPIHSKIRPLIAQKYKEATELNSKYLINCTDTHTHRSNNILTYDKYQQRFNKIKEKLKLNPQHRAHDGRMHFITTAKKYNMNEYAIKYIVGHSINDITEKVYTKRDIEWLKEEIEKIK